MEDPFGAGRDDFDDTLLASSDLAATDAPLAPGAFAGADEAASDPIAPHSPVDRRDLPTLHGDPAEAREWAQMQSGEGLCAVATVGMIASTLRGVEFEDHELVDLSHDLGITDDPTGRLTARQTADLLSRGVGIAADVRTGDLDDLRAFLDERRAVVLAVDADETTERSDDHLDGGAGTNHALLLTGIDDRRSIAYVNDPGRADGAGAEIPLEMLLDAWDDSGRVMVVTEPSRDIAIASPAPIALVDPPADGVPVVAVTGYVMLPVSIAIATLARRRGSDRLEL